MAPTPADKLALARARACTLAPYFTSGIRSLIPVECADLDTLAVTEKLVMLWDPAYVAASDPAELAAVVIHEYMHVFLKHAARGRALQVSSQDHSEWNKAADAAINESMGVLPLPPDCITPASLGLPGGQTAEAYYRALMKQKEEKQNKQQSSQNSQNSNKQEKSQDQDKQNSSQSGQDDASQQNDASGQGDGQSNGRQNSGQQSQNNNGQNAANASSGGASQSKGKPHKCGGCAGNAHAIESRYDAEIGRSKAEQERIVKTSAEAIRQAVQQGVGNVPGGIARMAEAILAPPRVNWRAQLATLVRDAVTRKRGHGLTTYTKINRRQQCSSIIRASNVRPIPRVAVALDTSGSMGTDEVSAAMAEVAGILKTLGTKIEFVACDTELGKLAPINNISEARKLITGGGGTDFRPVFAAFDKRRPAPDILVFVTDGQGPAPRLAPRYSVIWCLINSRTPPAPFGKVVFID